MAVTRIKNNQITDSTITYAKIANGTLVGSNFNPNLTLNSNVSIVGNLTVTGVSSTVSSTNTYVNDPLVVFNNGYVGSLSGYDIGILVNRNLASLAGYGSVNTAWIWNEADAAFEAIVTTDTGGGITSINNSGFANVKVGNLTANSLTITTGSLTVPTINSQFTGNAAFTYETSTNFSSGNAQITGGNSAWTTATATNFSSGNAQITGGNVVSSYSTATNFSSGNAQITGGNSAWTTATATNFSSGNAVITGGAISGGTGAFSTLQATNFSSGNAQITGGNSAWTTATATNFSSANAIISGGNAQGLTYLQATNFSTANAVLTGGSISGMNGAFTTLTATNFSSANAIISGGNAQGLTYLQATNFSTGNAVITGGSMSGVNGAFGTLVATNFSSGNSVITGGTINGTSVGATTAAAGFFTNTSTGNLTVTANATVGGNLTVNGNINVVTGNIIAINSAFFVGNTTTGFNALYAGIPSGYATLPQVVAQFSENYNGYAQINTQNINAGGDATTDYVATANNGTDTTFYVDLGINGSGYDPLSPVNSLGTSTYANDGYLYVQGNTSADIGGNLVIGTNTAGRVVRVISGGHDSANVVAVFNAAGTEATNTASGALVVTGGAGISGALYAGSINSAASVITTEVVTNLSSGNAVLTGGSITGMNGAFTTLTATNFSSGNIVGVLSGTSSTSNVALYESYTASTTNGTFYPSFTDRSATGNSAAYVNSSLTYNPGTNTLGVPIITVSSSAPSTSSSSGALVVTGGAGVGGNLWVGTNAVIVGNLTVQGTMTAIQSQTLDVTDLNITVAKGAASAAAANGAGITVDTAGATILYTSATDSWNFNKQVIGQFTTSNLVSTGGSITGMNGAFTTLTATNLSTANAVLSGGSITGMNGAFTTLTATNFSSGNAQITGGNAAWTTETATNFSTANAVLTGGSITGMNGAFTTLTATNLSSGNIVGILNGTATTANVALYDQFTSSTTNATFYPVFTDRNTTGNASNFVTSGITFNPSTNAVTATTFTGTFSGTASITSGSISGATGAFSTLVATNLSSGNAVLTGGSITGMNGAFTTLTATNFSSANAVISGGNIQGLSYLQAANVSTANAVLTGGSITGMNGAFTTLTATNFSSGNAQITGGNSAWTTSTATNFSTANAQITGGAISGTTGAFSTLTATNFSSGNAQITGGNASWTTETATNFSSGNARISGGYADAFPIGANTAATGAFTTLSTSGITTHAGNVVITAATETTAANIGALVIPYGGASISGNTYVGNNLYIGASALTQSFANPTIIAVDSGTNYAQIALKNTNANGSADYAAYGDTGTDASGWADMGFAGSTFNDVNYTITKPNDGYFLVKPTSNSYGGNLILGTSEVGSYNDIVFGVGSFNAVSEVARFHGNVSNNGTFVLKLPTNAVPAANTGAMQVWGGASIGSNLYVGGATTLGGTRAAGGDTIIQGKNDASLLWAKSGASYDQVLIGNSATMSTLVTGAKLQINSTDSILLPVGSTAQRPGSSGGTDTVGMFRYSTTTGAVEWYTGTAWQTASTSFTVIADQQFNGDGATTVFTLSDSQTTNSCIVSINGVIQIPTLAYAVTGGTTLTFTEAPASGDLIDVRKLTTTSTVTGLSDTTGYNTVDVSTSGVTIATGTVARVPAWLVDTSGALVPQKANVSVATTNTATPVDSFATATYRSAKYIIQATAGGKYQVMEALVVHDDTTPTITSYGIVQTNGNVGAVTASISAGTLNVNFVAANVDTFVRISKEYILI